MDLPIYVISALRGREKNLLQKLADANISYKIMPAVFFESFPDYFNGWRSLLLSREKLTLPEIGTARAHLDVYSDLIQENHDCALILEDDANITDLNLLLQTSLDFQRLMLEKPYLLLHYTKYALLNKNSEIIPNVFPVIRYPSSAVCYLISRQAAIYLLERNSNLDFLADFPKDSRIQWYLNTSEIIRHDSNDSLLHEWRTEAKQSKAKRLLSLIGEITFINFMLLMFIDQNLRRSYFQSIWYPKIYQYLSLLTGNRPFRSSS
jgi:GR25 family glycosyltransferase involved in LPS biosynthesis